MASSRYDTIIASFIIGRAEKNFPWGLHVGLVKDRESSSQLLILGWPTEWEIRPKTFSMPSLSIYGGHRFIQPMFNLLWLKDFRRFEAAPNRLFDNFFCYGVLQSILLQKWRQTFLTYSLLLCLLFRLGSDFIKLISPIMCGEWPTPSLTSPYSLIQHIGFQCNLNHN